MKICVKQSKKKTKVYGPSAERLKLLEKAQEEEAKRAEEKAKKKATWQQQHEAFQNALKSAAAVKAGAPPPADLVEVEDTRTPCPHCGRKFAADVADRHIPHCAKAIKRPNPVGGAPKRPGRSASPAASESGDASGGPATRQGAACAQAAAAVERRRCAAAGEQGTPARPPRAGAASPSKMATRNASPSPALNKRPMAAASKAR